jgi:hypothetical protein
MNLPYIVPRVVRHFLPETLVRSLLRRKVIIRPGIETRDATGAVRRYLDVLAERGGSFRGKRVLVFGYGGRFDIAAGLLNEGAAHVVLVDPYAVPERGPRPRPDLITLVQADVRIPHVLASIAPIDFVISTSVFEHLQDVDGTTRALAMLTRPDGAQIHFIDLRDHYFRYPFEMLCFSESTWRRWLNPTSHHNRYRLWDFRRVFEKSFGKVDLQVVSWNEVAFRKALPRIRPEFLSGVVEQDTAEVVRVVLEEPRAPQK